MEYLVNAAYGTAALIGSIIMTQHQKRLFQIIGAVCLSLLIVTVYICLFVRIF